MEDLADPAEAIGYLDVSLEEYQMDGDIPFFLKGLRNVVEAQGGVAAIAKKTNMDPQILEKMLCSKDALRVDTLRTILTALGCRLSIEPLETKELEAEMGNRDAPVAPTESQATTMELTTDN